MHAKMSKRAAKFLGAQVQSVKDRIKSAIHEIPKGDIKPLQGQFGGLFRLRVGGLGLFSNIWTRRRCMFTISAPVGIYISEVFRMTATTQEICEMVELLPESEQELAREFIRRMVLAWDPDFVKVTADEARDIEEGIRQIESGDFIDLDSI